jgi:hypothetical protein
MRSIGMNTILTIFLILGMTHSVLAKTDKNKKFARSGTITISGNMGYTSLGDDDTTRSTLPFMPTVGYTLWNQKTLAFELQASFQRASITTETSQVLSQSTSFVAIDPVLYWRGLDKKNLYPFFHLALGYYTQSQDSILPGLGVDEKDKVVTNSLSGYMIKSGVGISYVLGKKRGGFVKAQLDYAYSGLTDYDAKPAKGYNLSGLDVAIGIGLFL